MQDESNFVFVEHSVSNTSEPTSSANQRGGSSPPSQWTFVGGPSDEDGWQGTRAPPAVVVVSSHEGRQDSSVSGGSFIPSAGPAGQYNFASSPPEESEADLLVVQAGAGSALALPEPDHGVPPSGSMPEETLSAEHRQRIRQQAAEEAQRVIEEERRIEVERAKEIEEANRRAAAQLAAEEELLRMEDQRRRDEEQRREAADHLLAQKLAAEEEHRIAQEEERRREEDAAAALAIAQMNEESRLRRNQEEALAQQEALARRRGQHEAQELEDRLRHEEERRRMEAEEADRRFAEQLAENSAARFDEVRQQRIAEDEAIARALAEQADDHASFHSHEANTNEDAGPAVVATCRCLGASSGFHRADCPLRTPS